MRHLLRIGRNGFIIFMFLIRCCDLCMYLILESQIHEGIRNGIFKRRGRSRQTSIRTPTSSSRTNRFLSTVHTVKAVPQPHSYENHLESNNAYYLPTRSQFLAHSKNLLSNPDISKSENFTSTYPNPSSYYDLQK